MIYYGHPYINCMDGRLFMETGKGQMRKKVSMSCQDMSLPDG